MCVKIQVFRGGEVMPHLPVNSYKSCGGASCLHPQILPTQHLLDSYIAARSSETLVNYLPVNQV